MPDPNAPARGFLLGCLITAVLYIILVCSLKALGHDLRL